VSDRLLILRLSGDFYTKSRKTRVRFARRLAANIEAALKAHGIPHRLERTWSRFYLETPDPGAAEVLSRVFGIQSVSEVERRPWARLEDVVADGVKIFAEDVRGRSFAVRASRRGDLSRIGFRSTDVEIALGRALLDAGATRVDLSEPEVTASVEVEPDAAHFFADRVSGHGGLPVGVEGRALALVSGGFDSAVASWLMLKRGVQLDYVFCNLGGAAHRLGVLQVMKVIADRWSHGYRPRLWEIDFAPLVAELREKASPQNWQIVLKRLMLRAGAAVAHRGGRLGLVTGDAMGQVSSQTLQNLAVVSQAATSLPVLRPLLGFNKEEIVALSRRIGVHDLAAAVGEYCDLVPRRPATRAILKDVLRDEERMNPDLEGRLGELIDVRRSYDLRGLAPEALAPSGLEVDRVPPGATLIDLRSAAAFKAWHYREALLLDFPRALEAYGSFARDRAYVLVCEVGLKSAHLAERMREAGFEAWNFRGGIKELMALAEREKDLDPALLAPAVRDNL
jgi:thiamine biosynthesis protein ThiI